MDYFKIGLFGEFADDGARAIFVKSCKDLTQFSKHEEIIRKVIDLKNQQEDYDDNGDMDYYLTYGRIEISKIDPLFLNAFINVDELEELSNCCGYAITENTDLCSRCGEHCAVEILCDKCGENHEEPPMGCWICCCGGFIPYGEICDNCD